MDKVKEALHIRRKSKADNSDVSATTASGTTTYQEQDDNTRASIDSELAAMDPKEREAYLKEFEEADKSGEPKKGSLIEKLIARGNKRTEDQLAEESAAKKSGQDAVIR